MKIVRETIVTTYNIGDTGILVYKTVKDDITTFSITHIDEMNNTYSKYAFYIDDNDERSKIINIDNINELDVRRIVVTDINVYNIMLDVYGDPYTVYGIDIGKITESSPSLKEFDELYAILDESDFYEVEITQDDVTVCRVMDITVNPRVYANASLCEYFIDKNMLIYSMKVDKSDFPLFSNYTSSLISTIIKS